MVDYWECRRGLKRGEIPNPVKYLYRSYIRYLRSALPETKPASYPDFMEYFRKRGYQKATVARKVCWLLNKRIISANALKVR